MEQASAQGSTSSQPPWWKREGSSIPLDALATEEETGLPSEIEEAHRAIRLLARLAVAYRDRLEQELKHRYGSRSEKNGRGSGSGSGTEQNPSGDAGADNPGPETGVGGSQDADESAERTGGHGRRPIPAELPRDEVVVELEDEHCLTCQGPVHKLERLESYRYNYVPGHIRVRVLVRFRCVCDDPTCPGPFRVAKLPPEPIPKSRVTAAFLAHLLVTKFADHCPLYRFRKILLRQKVDLPLSTLVDYCKKPTALLKPLWELMKSQVLLSDIIGTDDTYVRVRQPGKKGALKGHLWAYGGDEQHPYVVFEFTPHWRGEAPQSFLATFKGYVQADAYKGYDKLFESGERIEVGCMAHARRKWVKARMSSPQVAQAALERIGLLYAVEEDAKELSAEQRKAVRQERSRPILDEFRTWMATQKARVLPKSAVGEAIAYAENQWTALTRYLEDGRLKIDNNAIERELRAVALGRKNWLAAGSDVGGETAAIGYTLIASALACGVEPVEWLTDVLERIVTLPSQRLEELLPDRWKAARATKQAATELPAASDNDRRAATFTEPAVEAATPPPGQSTSPTRPDEHQPQAGPSTLAPPEKQPGPAKAEVSGSKVDFSAMPAPSPATGADSPSQRPSFSTPRFLRLARPSRDDEHAKSEPTEPGPAPASAEASEPVCHPGRAPP